MRIQLVLAFLLLAIGSARAGDKLTVIKGLVTREGTRSMVLFEVIEGKRVEYASTKLDENFSYAFAIPLPKEGLYYLSDQSRREFIRVYLKPGEQLELDIDGEGYQLEQGSKENKLLYEWYKAASVITVPAFNWMKDSSTYRSFFPKLTNFLPQVPAFKKRINTRNRSFNELMHLIVDTDVEHAAIYFLMTPNTVHPKVEDYPDYYKEVVQPKKFSRANLLLLGDGVDYISRYTSFVSLRNKEAAKVENRLLWAAELLGNDTLKGALVASSLRYKTYEDLEKNIAPLKHYLVTDSMQASYFKALKAVSSFKKGSPSYNFSYPDVQGKMVSMNDLKGKVVLVDLWATWCGPCKVEIPHLKKLEEEFKGKNLAIVSISVDVEKDKEKWKAFIQKESLGGIQLFASGWSEVARYYDVAGIPRFMVFDGEGKVVTVDAPRPSSPELKTLLTQLLENSGTKADHAGAAVAPR